MSSGITALWCWYHGGPFRGYQSQSEGPTVQGVLTAAMQAAGFERSPVVAGRTDLGVHARMQVVGFRLVEPVAQEAIAKMLKLPASLGVALARAAPARFHAQWRACGKEYRYRLLLEDDPAWNPYGWRVDVDPQRVGAVLRRALGTHDFWAFHEKSSARTLRTLRQVDVVETGRGRHDLRLVGDGFGRYQVRYLVGGAVGVARGEIAEEDYVAGIERAVEFSGAKAPAQGLILWEVLYPDGFDPFSPADRQACAGVPREPPFI